LNHVSVDGVMQGPGRPGEDPRGGFQHSGWAQARGGDEAERRVVEERTRDGSGFLFGRRTYEELLRHWNSVPDNPWVASLNAATKYVATTHREAALQWPNSVALAGTSMDAPDVPNAVAQLRAQNGGPLVIMGSSVLIHALQHARLIDEYVLLIHPIVLGTGIRLFPPDGSYQTLRLVEPARTTATGVAIAVFERDE
jgi:dihydrofolate reductase